VIHSICTKYMVIHFLSTDLLMATFWILRHKYTWTESNVASRHQKLPSTAHMMKRIKALAVHLEGSNRSGRGGESSRTLSVLCFVPCFYLHRIIYFPYIPRMNARYKAVRGAADISTQAGSLETFELLARRARWVWGWWGRLSLSLSLLERFWTAREKRGVVLELGGGAASRG